MSSKHVGTPVILSTLSDGLITMCSELVIQAYVKIDYILLFTDIGLKLRTKIHGQVYYKIGVTCVFNAHGFYRLF